MENLIKNAMNILCSHCRRFENCYVFQDDLAILKEVLYALRERLRSIHPLPAITLKETFARILFPTYSASQE